MPAGSSALRALLGTRAPASAISQRIKPAHQATDLPPSTAITWPVIIRAFSDA